MKNYLTLLVILLLVIACKSQPEKATPQKDDTVLPNIILLIGDDHGYPYFGFMGADYVQTPNMDKLATNGTLFTNGYVPDNHCRPSLATLVTGMLPIQYKKEVEEKMRQEMATIRFPSPEAMEEWKREYQHHAMQYFVTLPKLLKQKGYNSFQGGKWWEFHYENGGFTHGMTTGWTAEDRKKGGEWFKKFMGGDGLALARATMEPVYDFIEKNKEEPFFIWYAPELPHYPFDAPEKYYNLYKDEDMTESAKRYYANCTWFDDGVGALRDYLKEVGELDNTLFIYVNDNGWEQAPDQEYWEDPMRSHNGGDKGKSSLYDMSFRSPIIFTWGDEKQKDKRLNELMHSADIPATILDIVDIEVPEHFFGQSYQPLLKGKDFTSRQEIIGNITTHRDEADVMGRAVEGYWIRTKDWFFARNITDDEIRLFDMKTDPNNDNNLVEKHPKVVEEMLRKIEEWK